MLYVHREKLQKLNQMTTEFITEIGAQHSEVYTIPWETTKTLWTQLNTVGLELPSIQTSLPLNPRPKHPCEEEIK